MEEEREHLQLSKWTQTGCGLRGGALWGLPLPVAEAAKDRDRQGRLCCLIRHQLQVVLVWETSSSREHQLSRPAAHDAHRSSGITPLRLGIGGPEEQAGTLRVPCVVSGGDSLCFDAQVEE